MHDLNWAAMRCFSPRSRFNSARSARRRAATRLGPALVLDPAVLGTDAGGAAHPGTAAAPGARRRP